MYFDRGPTVARQGTQVFWTLAQKMHDNVSDLSTKASLYIFIKGQYTIIIIILWVGCFVGLDPLPPAPPLTPVVVLAGDVQNTCAGGTWRCTATGGEGAGGMESWLTRRQVDLWSSQVRGKTRSVNPGGASMGRDRCLQLQTLSIRDYFNELMHRSNRHYLLS